MDEAELSSLLQRQIQSATGYLGGELTEQRREAMDAYMGEPLGNEIEGRSQVVSSDVLDVVESVMPDIMQIFTSSDEAVEFAPKGEGDEEVAQQATDYVNHIWNVDNEGFLIYHDLFKDALLQKNGVGKAWWDENPGETRSTHTGLDADQVSLILDADGVEVIEHEEYWPEKTQEFLEENGIDPDSEEAEALFPPDMQLAGKLHDLTVKRKIPPRIVVENVAPENFLVSRRASSLDDAPFVCHWEEVTESELIEDGYDPEQIKDIPNESENEFNDERVSRFNNEDEFPFNEQPLDRSTRRIVVYECYVRIDMDDDGIAELRKIKVAGPAYEVLRFKDGTLDDEPVHDHPFFSVTPIRMPHKFFGRSLADLCMDIYKIKTSLWRSLLDNVYNVNNARAFISNKVSLDDYLDNKVGAPVRVDDNTAHGHAVPLVTPSIGNHIYPALEYIDTVRETRTGINRLGQGLDPDALNSTASGINQLLGRSQQRVLLIAQVFAHGVRDAFKKILKLSVMHQDKPRVVRLRGEWVEVDPRAWDADMDVNVNVGLGRGTQDQKIVTARMVLEATMNLLQIQGGLSGPFVLPHHVRNAFAKFYEVSGLKSADPYVEEISEQASQQIVQQMGQQQDPEAEAKKAELQMKGRELAQKAKEAEAKMTLEFTKEQNAQIAKMVELGQEQMAQEAKLQLDAFLGQQKLALEEYKIDKQAQTARTKGVNGSASSK